MQAIQCGQVPQHLWPLHHQHRGHPEAHLQLQPALRGQVPASPPAHRQPLGSTMNLISRILSMFCISMPRIGFVSSKGFCGSWYFGPSVPFQDKHRDFLKLGIQPRTLPFSFPCKPIGFFPGAIFSPTGAVPAPWWASCWAPGWKLFQPYGWVS